MDAQSNAADAVLLAERNQLRTALAAARGTVLDLRSHLSDLRAAQDFLRLSRESALEAGRAAEALAASLREQLDGACAERDSLRAERNDLHAERDALRADRDWRHEIGAAQQTRIDGLELAARHAATLAPERDKLARRLASLDRLVRELRWDDGPRAIRVILPAARIIRRLRATLPF